ncbi:MBL fold metallo-hydrolase, partial [bacterium K02(2017)]
MTTTIKFLGATNTVTGSKFLLSANESSTLIDCGLFQGLKNLRLQNWATPPFDVAKIDQIVLTHGHLDHSGYTPLLAKHNYNNPIFTTAGTKSLCNILLKDAAYLQEEEANYLNHHKLSKHKPALPLYCLKDALKALSLFKGEDYNKWIKSK